MAHITEGREAPSGIQLRLTIPSNVEGEDRGKWLHEQIAQNSFNLTLLEVLENDIGNLECVALGEALKMCARLTTLDISKNRIGNDGCLSLAEGLKRCGSLTTLHISHNQIGDEGCRAIGEGLKMCPELTTLGANYNQIGDAGCAALAAGLKNCAELTVLGISRNQIGEAGCSALADTLTVCTKLSTLFISFNQTGPRGCVALMEGLQMCTSLTSLHFTNNEIGDEGCRVLAEAMRMCHRLSELFLVNNAIGDVGCDALADGLENCSRLVSLGINGNRINSFEGLCNKAPTTLRFLSIAKNNIKSVPVSFLRLQRLRVFGVEQNSWSAPFDRLVDDLEALQSYLKESARGVEENHALRLMLVGMSTAGKTSLKRSLLSPENKTLRIPLDNRTAGIKIDALPKDMAEDLDIPMWDFGGEEIYNAAHQLFFSDRCVYVLVWRPTELADEEDAMKKMVNVWLEQIHEHVPDATVVLVGTHAKSDARSNQLGDVDGSGIAQASLFCKFAADKCAQLNIATRAIVEKIHAEFDSVTDYEEEDGSQHPASRLSQLTDGEGQPKRIKLIQFWSEERRDPIVVDNLTGFKIAELRNLILDVCRSHPAIGEGLPSSYRILGDAISRHWKQLHERDAARLHLTQGEAVDAVRADDFVRTSAVLDGRSEVELQQLVKNCVLYWHFLGMFFVEGDVIFADPRVILQGSTPLLAAAVQNYERNAHNNQAAVDELQIFSETGRIKQNVAYSRLWTEIDQGAHEAVRDVLVQFGLMAVVRSAQDEKVIEWIIPGCIGPAVGATLATKAKAITPRGRIVYGMHRIPNGAWNRAIALIVSNCDGNLRSEANSKYVVGFSQSVIVINQADKEPDVVVRLSTNARNENSENDRIVIDWNGVDLQLLQIICKGIEQTFGERFGKTVWWCRVGIPALNVPAAEAAAVEAAAATAIVAPLNVVEFRQYALFPRGLGASLESPKAMRMVQSSRVDYAGQSGSFSLWDLLHPADH